MKADAGRLFHWTTVLGSSWMCKHLMSNMVHGKNEDNGGEV